ncbi:MAG: ATP-binding protein [bacterium]|nr:ATP-binding protein [bacterium]
MGIFDKQELLQILHGFNPWWSDKSFKVPDFKRIAFNSCLANLSNLHLQRATLLSGPRRVGKTTILQQTADHLIKSGQPPKSILYLSLDHPLLKLNRLEKIIELYHSEVHPEEKPATLLLDEVQYVKDWATEIKLLVDFKPHLRILATGSASVAQKHELAESGVGRWDTIPIPTLSFYEFLRILGEPGPDIGVSAPIDLVYLTQAELGHIAQKSKTLLPWFKRYLLVGGFPETAKLEDVSLGQRLLREDVVERVLKRDMASLFGVRHVDEMERLFYYLCKHPGGILSKQTCAKELGVPANTVADYLGHLEQANLIYRLPPLSTEGKQVLKARNKYYLVDAALRNAVLLKGEEILLRDEEMGLIVETTVMRHLYAYYYSKTPKFGYWRDSRTKKEVDIIVQRPDAEIPFEVKYRENPKITRKDGIIQYSLEKGIDRAYVVTKNIEDFGEIAFEEVTTQIFQIPAHILCYLLGSAETRTSSPQPPKGSPKGFGLRPQFG